MLFMKRVLIKLREYGEKELSKLGIDKDTVCDLVYEGINHIPYSKTIEGKNAEEFFILEKGADYTYCMIGNFIGLVFDSANETIIEEVPRELLEGCTAYQVDLILQGSKKAPFSLKERLEDCIQHHAYA